MNKLQKAKKDDFTLEESARSQKAKYDESSDDVQRRMLDIKEAEVDSINDLSTFLDAELAYYDRAREILMQCKKDWPAYVLLQGCFINIFTNNMQYFCWCWQWTGYPGRSQSAQISLQHWRLCIFPSNRRGWPSHRFPPPNPRKSSVWYKLSSS